MTFGILLDPSKNTSERESGIRDVLIKLDHLQLTMLLHMLILTLEPVMVVVLFHLIMSSSSRIIIIRTLNTHQTM
jgi:hypothetical protein